VRVGLQEARFLLDRIAERELGEVAGGQRDGVAVIGHALDVVDLGYAREDVRLRDQQHVAVILEDRARTTLRTGLIAISVAIAIAISVAIAVPIAISVPVTIAITRVTITIAITRVAITISVPGIAIPVSGIPVAITRIAVSITRISVPVAISVPIAGRVRVPITVTRGLESGAPITLIR
jgi:hypothetical protein